MNKIVKSIIVTTVVCVAIGGILSCGAKDRVLNERDSGTHGGSESNVQDFNDYNIDSNAQTPQHIRYYNGVRILDDSDGEVYCTSWQQIVQNNYEIEDYTITLDANKSYKFQGCLISKEEGSMEMMIFDGLGIDINGENYYTTYGCTFDCSEENIAIDNSNCGYYEFNFIGLQAGECAVRFTVTISYSNAYDSKIETYNLLFIFE